ncbi:MAG: transcriptional regulator, TetR family [Acidimicrobiales bacterium]|nr:transcriptional regulator, TetR family [Acidimicrobiales bacterium]
MQGQVRERKKVSTRHRVRAVALELFLRQGYAATRLEDIADAAEVSVRTFYRYFPSKDALLFSGFEDALPALCEAIRRRDTTLPVLQSLREAVAGAADVMDSVSDVLKYIWVIGADDRVIQARAAEEIVRWRNGFAAAIAEQTSVPVHDRGLQIVATAVHGTITAGVAHWRGTGGNGRLSDEVRRALDSLEDLPATAQALDGSRPRTDP